MEDSMVAIVTALVMGFLGVMGMILLTFFPPGNSTNSIKRQEIERKQTCARDDGGDILTLTLPAKLFDCALCGESLQPPLFQCAFDHHILCSQCCRKDQKCPLCNGSTSELSCPMIESILSSIKLPCKYTVFGCKERISHPLKRPHEDSCPFTPCTCPVNDCKFQGSPRKLSTHIQSQHPLTRQGRVHYNAPFRVSLSRSEPFYVVHGSDDDHLFLLLNGRDFPSGNSLSMVCIRAVAGNSGEYELKVETGKESFLQMKATLPSVREWKGGCPGRDFLFVPGELSGKSGDVDVVFRIKKS